MGVSPNGKKIDLQEGEMMDAILVTGAAGYVGWNLCRALLEKGYSVRGSLMNEKEQQLLPNGVEPFVTGEIAGETDWSSALHDVASVVHLAARVHQKEEKSEENLVLFRRTNTDATVALAEQALANGIRSFVFLSSVAVHGVNKTEEPLRIDSPIRPTTHYGQSKWEAEQKLTVLFKDANASLTILRPTMVYGPQAPGNFARLTGMVRTGIPLPLGSVNNKRHFVFIDKLVSLIMEAMEQTEAGVRTRFACDEQPLSTKELVQLAGKWEGKKTRLFPFPTDLLPLLLACIGKKDEWDKLAGDFLVQRSR